MVNVNQQNCFLIQLQDTTHRIAYYHSNGRPFYFSVVVSFFLSSFFLAYSQRSEIGCLPYFHTWCGLSANLECMSEMCCTHGKYRMQKWWKKSPSLHHWTTLSGYIFATEACIDNRKKILLSSYISYVSPQYGELRPTNGWDRLGALVQPTKCQRVSRLGFITAPFCTVAVGLFWMQYAPVHCVKFCFCSQSLVHEFFQYFVQSAKWWYWPTVSGYFTP